MINEVLYLFIFTYDKIYFISHIFYEKLNLLKLKRLIFGNEKQNGKL